MNNQQQGAECMNYDLASAETRQWARRYHIKEILLNVLWMPLICVKKGGNLPFDEEKSKNNDEVW